MSSYVDSSTTTREHCESMSSLHPDLAPLYTKISTLYTSKLWHQLTTTILEFTSNPSNLRTTSGGSNSFLALYHEIILPIDKKLNPLSLARIASAVSNSSGDVVASRATLENLLEKKRELGVPATLYIESKLALLTLAQDDIEGVKDMIKSGSKTLEELEGSGDTIVHSAFYEASMTYYKIAGPPEAFYQQALLYLNYTPLDTLSDQDKYLLAMGISLAALTGDGVFNFGEILTNPILKCLGTEGQWLLELMHVFGEGDVEGFRTVTTKYDAEIRSQPALVSRADLLQEKITLISLVNMIFQRPSAERTLEFSEIASKIHVSEDQVEWVIMRALSLGLIKGSMDQVEKSVTVSWIVPRVLNKEQLKALAGRFGEWAGNVGRTKDYMGERIPALA